jgi:ribonuclease HII
VGGPDVLAVGGPDELAVGGLDELGPGGPEEAMERSGAPRGTVGVALGEQPRPPAPVGEDVVMEGGVR